MIKFLSVRLVCLPLQDTLSYFLSNLEQLLKATSHQCEITLNILAQATKLRRDPQKLEACQTINTKF